MQINEEDAVEKCPICNRWFYFWDDHLTDNPCEDDLFQQIFHIGRAEFYEKILDGATGSEYARESGSI